MLHQRVTEIIRSATQKEDDNMLMEAVVSCIVGPDLRPSTELTKLFEIYDSYQLENLLRLIETEDLERLKQCSLLVSPETILRAFEDLA